MEHTKGEYNFNKDLAKGEAGENSIINYMSGMGYEFIDRCKNNKYDFKMSYKELTRTYELKTDMYCRPDKDTGNIAVEFESRGKKSGISVTQADYFVTYFLHLNEIWNIKTESLREIIKYFDVPLKEGKGDPGSNTKFFLINRENFRQYFKVHKIQ